MKPTAYERSDARRKFLLGLTARLTATVEFAADDPHRKGQPEDHTYSLTREQSSAQPRSPIA